MDYAQWFAQRLVQLRIEKGVSSRDMSLSLGQSESYINKIENRRALPSMSGFFSICDYFGIRPQDYFNAELESPGKVSEIQALIGKLPPHKAEHILQLVRDLTE